MIQQIGKYEVTGELGVGGFGRVYRAYDPTVKRVVAIKVLNAGSDSSLITRFRAEAMTAGNLHHQNIVVIHEFVEDQDLQYLVMEYLDGADLQQLLAQKAPLTLLDKMEIMSQAAHGLQFAHEHGVVHRDVKPANIMRLTDGSVKIMDFGIARLTRDASTRLTQTGYLVGTIHYMAPEQFRGGDVDALCDIWSFGVVYYELLTGVNPFYGSDPVTMMYRITSENPEPITAFEPQCPPELQTAIQRLLMKKRADRYQSIEDFLLDTDPVMRSMARGQLPDLIKRAGMLIRSSEIEEAQSVVRRILELDSSNREARSWRDELRERARQRSMRPRIEELIRQAEEEAEKRNFRAAIERIDSALRLDPINTTLQNRLEQLRADEEQVKRAERLVGEARRDFEREDLTGAFQHANQAIDADPKNSDAPPLLEKVRRAIEEREAQAKLKGGLSKAKGLMLMQAYEDAIAVLAELAIELPGNAEVNERLAEARRLKDAQQIQDRIKAAIGESKEMLRRGEFAKALRILEDLDRQSPDNQLILPLLAYAREQLEAERKAAEIEELAREASAQCEAKNFDRAIAIVERALQLYPDSDRIVRLRQSVLDAQRSDQDEERGREISEAERLLARGQAASATRLLSNLTLQYPAEESVRALLERARTLEREQKERDAIQSILTRAISLAGQKQWSDALATVEQGLRAYPDRPELLEQASRIRDQVSAEADVAAIEREIAKPDLDSAISMSEAALKRHPGDSRVSELLGKARDQRELKDLLQNANRRLMMGDVDEAAQIVSDARKRFADSAALKELAERIEAGGRRHRDLAEAQDALRRRQFEAARKIVERLIASDRDDVAACSLLALIRAKSEEQQQRQQLEWGRAEVEQLLRSHRYEEAIAKLEALAREFPLDNLKEEIEAARGARNEHARKQLYSRGRSEAEQFSAQLRPDDAVRRLTELLIDFPDDPGLTQDLAAAKAAKKLREERLRIEARISELEELFRKGDAEAVRKGAAKLLAEREEPRAKELIEWANRSIEQSKEIRKDSRTTNSRKLLWIALASIAAVSIALAAWRLVGGGGDAIRLNVEPAELTFSYQLGSAPPEAQSFRLKIGGTADGWTVSGADPWFSMTPSDGATSAQVTVAVAPTGLSAGVYTGIATVALRNGSIAPKTIRVRLRVAPEPVVNPPKDDTRNAQEENRKAAEDRKAKEDAKAKADTKVKEDARKLAQENERKEEERNKAQDTIESAKKVEEIKPVIKPAVDCHAATYRGSFRGSINWTGRLEPNDSLEFGRSNITSRGPHKGPPLPGCDVSISLQSAGVTLAEGPTAANNFGRLIVKANAPVTSVIVEWKAK